MSVITSAIYDKLSGDSELVSLLSTYGGQPAIFTMDPAPGDAQLPYIVTSGEVTQVPFDTKVTRGRSLIREIRCYDRDDGNPTTVESISERARELLHRQVLLISGYQYILSSVDGPTARDEEDAYGRILTLTMIIEELEGS